MFTDEEDNLIDYLEETYGCHTLILYGSRAKGTHRPDSDWDLIGLNDAEHDDFCHAVVPGIGEINAYIYPRPMGIFNPNAPSKLFIPLDAFVRRLHDARVLVEEDGLGTAIVHRAQVMKQGGPAKISPEKREHLEFYFFRQRLGEYLDPNDPHFKHAAAPLIHTMRHEAMTQVIFNYFRLRGKWVPAPNDWYAYFERHDPAFLALLNRAEETNAKPEDFAALFAKVMEGEADA